MVMNFRGTAAGAVVLAACAAILFMANRKKSANTSDSPKHNIHGTLGGCKTRGRKTVCVRSFVEDLVHLSDKAARIAAIARKVVSTSNEKKGADANARFDADFKTLVDVLNQVMFETVLGAKYPALLAHIHGEESGYYQGTKVEIHDREADTAAGLSRHLEPELSAQLAAVVHDGVGSAESVESPMVDLKRIPLDLELDSEDLGIWIDPIDGTNEFIAPHDGFPSTPSSCVGDDPLDNLALKGLRVVTVLVGVFSRTTGQPLIGVVSQPFASKHTTAGGATGWGRISYWGVCVPPCPVPASSEAASAAASAAAAPADGMKSPPPVRVHSVNLDAAAAAAAAAAATSSGGSGGAAAATAAAAASPMVAVVLSSSEDKQVRAGLSTLGEVCTPAGCGYKLMTVLTARAAAYVCTKGSTYRWDTCGPHAILRALGGDVYRARRQPAAIDAGGTGGGGVTAVTAASVPVRYNEKDEGQAGWANRDGVVALLRGNCAGSATDKIWEVVDRHFGV